MQRFMIRLAWITAAIVLLGLMILPIFYPPAQLPYHYYMDGPNYYITNIETQDLLNAIFVKNNSV